MTDTFTRNADSDGRDHNWIPVTQQQDSYSDAISTIIDRVGMMGLPKELLNIVAQNAVAGDIVEWGRIGNRYELYVNTFYVASVMLG